MKTCISTGIKKKWAKIVKSKNRIFPTKIGKNWNIPYFGQLLPNPELGLKIVLKTSCMTMFDMPPSDCMGGFGCFGRKGDRQKKWAILKLINMTHSIC